MATNAPPHRGLILVIEDDRDIRESLVDALEQEGYAVVSAIDGVEAMGHLNEGLAPELILLDLVMPRMNGASFHDEISQVPSWRGIPLVLLTADPRARLLSEKMGAASFLRKPVRLEDLLNVAAHFADKPQNEGSKERRDEGAL